MNILMLEDDAEIARTLRDYLCDEEYGHNCDSAHSIEEAEKLLRSKRYDLVLADFMICGQGCTEFLRHVKEMQPHAQLCVMSAWPKSKEIAKEHNVDCFIPKPFELEIIEQIFSRS
jgi:DNA-binding response OmpR family regulator